MPLWLPFHRAAAKYRQTNINQVEIPHEFVKRQMVRSSVLSGIRRHLVNERLSYTYLIEHEGSLV